MLQGKASIQLSMTDVTKELSRQWKALPEKDKEVRALSLPTLCGSINEIIHHITVYRNIMS